MTSARIFDLPDRSVDLIEALSCDDLEVFWLQELGLDLQVAFSWSNYEATIDDLFRVADRKSAVAPIGTFVRFSVNALPDDQRKRFGRKIIDYVARCLS